MIGDLMPSITSTARTLWKTFKDKLHRSFKGSIPLRRSNKGFRNGDPKSRKVLLFGGINSSNMWFLSPVRKGVIHGGNPVLSPPSLRQPNPFPRSIESFCYVRIRIFKVIEQESPGFMLPMCLSQFNQLLSLSDADRCQVSFFREVSCFEYANQGTKRDNTWFPPRQVNAWRFGAVHWRSRVVSLLWIFDGSIRLMS